MAKEFLDWNTKFSSAQIAACRTKWLRRGASHEDVMSYSKWPEKVSSWDQEFIQQCTYHVSTAPEWQLFRVSMKGLTTYEKLYMLHNRFAELVASRASATPSGPEWAYYKIEKCRIDNYLGALVRGGQLNSQHEVMR